MTCCPHLPRLPQAVASVAATEDSGAALALAFRSRRRERALTEAEAYARCHGQRALCPVRVPADPDRYESLRVALLRPEDELRR